MLTEVGEVELDVPRDRDGSFKPQIVKKRQRRLAGVDELVISLAAKGLTTGEIAAHFADVYGAEVSRDTISRITDRVLEDRADLCAPPGQEHLPPLNTGAASFPQRAGSKCLYLAVRSLDPTGRGQRRWINRWKSALNAFAITFEGRIDLNNN